jgi:hypothetical protein
LNVLCTFAVEVENGDPMPDAKDPVISAGNIENQSIILDGDGEQ